jgi:hypothetical protein
MSIYTRGEPANTADFRASTERHAALCGVAIVPKRCKCVVCQKMRTAITGKVTKRGFVCNFCSR